MDVKSALKGQYHAAFRMLRECVEACPDDVWLQGRDGRYFWRIVYHAAFFGNLYMAQDEAAFTPWRNHQPDAIEIDDVDGGALTPYSKSEMLEYIDQSLGAIDETVDNLDLDAPDCGFSWYGAMPKLEHELLSVRHVQGHVGQLSERLFMLGIDTAWISRRASEKL